MQFYSNTFYPLGEIFLARALFSPPRQNSYQLKNVIIDVTMPTLIEERGIGPVELATLIKKAGDQTDGVEVELFQGGETHRTCCDRILVPQGQGLVLVLTDSERVRREFWEIVLPQIEKYTPQVTSCLNAPCWK